MAALGAGAGGPAVAAASCGRFLRCGGTYDDHDDVAVLVGG